MVSPISTGSRTEKGTEDSERVSSLPEETIEFANRIFKAAKDGDLILLKSAIGAGLPVNLTDHNGNTLLILASYYGHLETVEYLLSKGVELNRLNDKNQSAVAGAVYKGFKDVVKALIDNGADIKLGRPNAIDCTYMFKRDDYWDFIGASIDDVSPEVPKRV
ncbi:ankyrin repeat protein [Phakopsora pachyrhizi]|uniref:Ankyrin repeat protein n=1 Tax=Phakopsora pachyrhizi TaxID=170000 RepID=A0AAV0ATP4_PHAPC|nr:ankyrin repeat protein [Phakopsora pachyrhizi]KAI8448149.1 ankyrin repeat protein [Phakopsora pachyrhizi]CAH7671587.1 ankyrin repeat protein [Phakopsora pachyrhizi]